jgi:hypothetical protein
MGWRDWLAGHSAYNHRCKDPSIFQYRDRSAGRPECELATAIQQRHRRSPGHLGLYTFKVFDVSYLLTRQSLGPAGDG